MTIGRHEPVYAVGRPRIAKGVLVSLPDTNLGREQRVLRFQYNPENITRSVDAQWEHEDDRKGVASNQDESRLDGQRGGGLRVQSEKISLRLIFDATEVQVWDDASREDGVLPELALLREIAFGQRQAAEVEQEQNRIDVLHPPEVLLILGKRTFPIVITSLSVTEKRFDTELVPVRAEVDLQMTVLEPQEAAENQAIVRAFKNLAKQRSDLAVRYSETSSEVAAVLNSLMGTERTGG